MQDFLGMICPRIATGFNRNRDITGEYNYGEAAEVAIREILTGPPMFLIPMALLWGFKKVLGKACDVPVEHIKGFSEIFKNTTAQDATKETNLKSDFYKNVIRNALSEASNGELQGKKLEQKATEFAQNIIDIEQSRPMSAWQKIKGKVIEGSRDDKLSKLNEQFVSIKKSYSKNPSENFSSVKLNLFEDSVSAGFSKFLGMLKNYTDDITNYSKKNGLSKDIVENFCKKRVVSRNGVILALLASVVGFCVKIPDWYQLHEVNPGLNGLVDDPDAKKHLDYAKKSMSSQTTATPLLDKLQSPFGNKNSISFLATTQKGGNNAN